LLDVGQPAHWVRRFWEQSMMIPFWWAVVAFILGGTGGLVALAICSSMADFEEREAAKFDGIGHTV
jgi:RsiW-degrading membrane proteinase PrsW (M82 family)